MRTVTKAQAKRSQIIVAVALAVAILGPYVVSFFHPFTEPYAKFPLHIIRCGGLPVIASDFAGGNSYTTPESDTYGVDPFKTSGFFCTEKEAKANGYERSD